jgi:DUF4097 and DUF4098 domain-containing protein YvlB
MSRKSLTLTLLLAAALLTAAGDRPRAGAQAGGELTEEFHQTYPLAAGGRVSLSNINGGVRVTSWDRNEVKVDAVKRARRPERLREAEIKVEASGNSVRIETEYTGQRWGDSRHDRDDNPATVEYALTVPRGVVIEDFNLVNGGLDLENLSGSVKASSINGKVSAKGLSGPVNLSVINGRLDASFDRLGEGQSVTLSSVNGPLALTLPSDASAHLRASTVHGSITNDFSLPVRVGRHVGRDLEGRLGAGAARVRLSNVNGQISLRRADDKRPQSPVTNLLSEAPKFDERDADDDEQANIAREAARETREAMREAEREAREIEREARREAERELRESEGERRREIENVRREAARQAREAERLSREIGRDVARAHGGGGGDARRLIARESNTLAVTGRPRVRLETFDGHVNVRAWDKAEVSYTATKRASNEREMQGVKVLARGGGSGEVTVRAEFDKSFAREHVEREGRTVVFSSGASVELDVYVPRDSTLFVSTGDGRVRVEGVRGDVDLRTGDGPVDVSGARGKLRVATGDGPVRVEDFEGDCEARTGDGRITLDGRFNSLSARTGDGSITLSVPSDLNADVETVASNVVSDGVAVEQGAGEDRVRRWRVGGGGATLRLQTGDGQVVIRRR